MLWQEIENKAPWYATREIIDSWLKDRQELLVLYYNILKIKPFDEENDIADSQSQALATFCQLLVDYASLGHFKIFEKIAEISELLAPDTLGLDREVMIKILRTTMYLVDFSNRYSKSNDNLDQLTNDLSILGEQLSHRLELEDELIKSYVRATTATSTDIESNLSK